MSGAVMPLAELRAASPAVCAAAEVPGDPELMRRLASGDHDALATIVERHQRRLVRYLARLAGSTDRAEELAQEAFLRLLGAAPRWRPADRLEPYLYRIATNLLRSEERRRARWRLLAPLFGAAPPAALPGPQSELLAGELQRQVARAVAALPLHFRAPLLLHEVEEWSCAAIAAALGCREATVKTRLYRARARLRAALTPYVAADTSEGSAGRSRGSRGDTP